ncbi:hypothetical protein ENSA5_35050 [Enhygromyxa salina]|uniref:DUF423 domain-containing protein n=1 Tax=Enhygromyxa salina TaxID=215803 RepID=A0A2S9XWL2_9BACT|nr:DUF423 domain-containing protein [Enhygromyxa salina]PRP97120.1 hypothetical protein ENSA5_35050 [Enhygromyxa salina]
MTDHTPLDQTHARRTTMMLAGALGLLGVAAGAFGAHGLESRLTPEQLEWWQTAARYQQIHALALLLVGWGAGPWTRWRTVAAAGFCGGVLVFSSTLYAMALGGPRLLGAVTPLGGLGLILGWAAIVAHAYGLPTDPEKN